jgi:hypothetical protein
MTKIMSKEQTPITAEEVVIYVNGKPVPTYEKCLYLGLYSKKKKTTKQK